MITTKTFMILMLSAVAFIEVNAQCKINDPQHVSSTDTVIDTSGDKYIFIRHDSIPLILTDSVIDFKGGKKAVKDLRDYKLYNYALTPLLPLSQKRFSHTESVAAVKEGKGNFFKVTDGMLQAGINYVAKIHDQEVIIDSHEKFRQLFAPVETVQEAIAFAYYFTDSSPLYNLDYLVEVPPIIEKDTTSKYYLIDTATVDTVWAQQKIKPILRVRPIEKQWIIYTPEIISSYAVKVEDGYELLLYHYQVFGCEHPYIRRHIKVYFNGIVQILDEEAAFQSWSDVGNCVD